GNQGRWALLQFDVNVSVSAQPGETRLRDRVGDEDARHQAQATRLGSVDSNARCAAANAAPRVTGCPLASRPRSSTSTVATTSSSWTAPRSPMRKILPASFPCPSPTTRPRPRQVLNTVSDFSPLKASGKYSAVTVGEAVSGSAASKRG